MELNALVGSVENELFKALIDRFVELNEKHDGDMFLVMSELRDVLIEALDNNLVPGAETDDIKQGIVDMVAGGLGLN